MGHRIPLTGREETHPRTSVFVGAVHRMPSGTLCGRPGGGKVRGNTPPRATTTTGRRKTPHRFKPGSHTEGPPPLCDCASPGDGRPSPRDRRGGAPPPEDGSANVILMARNEPEGSGRAAPLAVQVGQTPRCSAPVIQG